jgi:hypothetical protein
MSPALILTFLLAALLAMLPVRRLHQAGWTSGALMTSWVVYVALILVGIDAGAGSKYLLPVLVVLFVLPYAIGPARLERIGRLFGARSAPARRVINVTPPGAPGVVEPTAEPVAKHRGRKPPVEYR